MNDYQLLEKMEHVGGLLFRKLQNNLSETDRIILKEWINNLDPISRKYFEEITEFEQIQAALHQLYEINETAALESIQKKIHLETVLAIPYNSKNSSSSFGSKNYKYIAAAVFFALIVISLVFRERTSHGNNFLSATQRFKNDISPGGNRGILTLSDGNQIVLDDVPNGELARQGSSKIFKVEDGKIVYHSTGIRSDAYNTISTPRGGQYQVELPDGSEVWLNASSSLKFPTLFHGNERIVELEGEAFFKVAKKSNMPFKVNIVPYDSFNVTRQTKEPMKIEVIGTDFNIMAYPDEVSQKTTLIDGAVKVTVGDKSVILKPGQQAQNLIKKDSRLFSIVTDINVEEVIAWRNGLFDFQEAPIESVMRQFRRWYGVDIVYEGKINQQFIGKIPRNVNISEALKILESTGWVHFAIDGKKIIVSP